MNDTRADLVTNLRQLLELDRGLGLEWLGKGGLTAATPAKPGSTPPDPAPPVASTASATSGARAEPVAPVVMPVSKTGITLPASDLATIAAEIARCTACGLCTTRIKTVPGEGHPTAEIVFIGEGPGADEDASGQPFVGKAGELLTQMIKEMGFPRSAVYICNVVKCRPPGNRTPEPAEVAACMGYLHRQLAAIKPKVICTLGNTPLRALMGDDTLGITRLRGQRLDYRGIPLIPTFHPADLLRNPPAKKPCWEDLKTVLGVLGRTPPPRRAEPTAD